MLLDEADVFLAERTNEPNQNALVSVFLRELEYYKGVLFLTTNRVNSFDPAIMSRIHLPLKYSSLGRGARIAIWQFFLQQAETKNGHHACHKKVVERVAENDLNGREVRKYLPSKSKS